MSELRIGRTPRTDSYQRLPESHRAVIVSSNALESSGSVSYTAHLGEAILFSAREYGGLKNAQKELLSLRQKQQEHDGIGMDIYPYEIGATEGWVGIRNVEKRSFGEDFIEIQLKEGDADARLVTVNPDNIAQPKTAHVTRTIFSLEGLETFVPGRFTARPLTRTLSQVLYDFQMKQGEFYPNEENA